MGFANYYQPVSPGVGTGGPQKRHARRLLDWGTTFLLLLVWAFIVLISVMLLGWTMVASSSDSVDGQYVTPDEVAGILAYNALPVLFAALSNEILVDRAWRRIHYFALGKRAWNLSNRELANNLRAANFQWSVFLWRAVRCQASGKEFKSALSWALLRWGTTISIASAQLSVSWRPVTDEYLAHKRYIGLVGPAALHAACIFGSVMLWRWPWVFFSDRANNAGLLRKYKYYQARVQGSLANYQDIAKTLEASHMDPRIQISSVKLELSTGRQMIAKLKGLSPGLICMFIPPALAWLGLRTNHVLTLAEYRFAFTLVFLLQNVSYSIALDFAVWNISLDGFCRTPKARPNKTLRHLGYSSGGMLFAKACRQRRPLRSVFFLWMFWLQASLMRFLTIIYTLAVTVLSYSSMHDMSDILDPSFWIGWLTMTLAFTFPLFLLWLLKKVEAPVCGVDGWRWAQIAQTALHEEGFYGVEDGRAVWSRDVETFSHYAGQVLM